MRLLLALTLLVGACTTTAQRNDVVWRSLAPAPSARTEVVATAVGTQIYAVGGYRGDGGTVATVEILDTVSGRWGNGPALPVAVNHAMAATVKDTVYVFGGYQADGKPSTAAFRLEPTGWRAVAAMPEGRSAGTAAAVEGKIYLAGGVTTGGLAQQTLVYDTAADTWSTAAGLLTPREHLGGAAFGGLVYTVGGRKAGVDTNLAAFEVFDPKSGQWRKLPDLPTKRGGLAAAATCNGWIVAVGGEAGATFPEAEAFDARAGGWRTLPGLPTPRHGLGVTAIGTTIYTIAGGPRPGLFVANNVESIDLAPLGAC